MKAKTNARHYLILMAIGLATLCPYATGKTWQDNNLRQFNRGDIPFDDPAHPAYFNYQNYLIKHGQPGETASTWKLLPAAEKTKKVADGEMFLSKLYAELITKKHLNSEEQELFQAVWGKINAQIIAIHQAAIAQEESAPKKSIGVFAKNLGVFQSNKNWNRLFDGDNHSSISAGDVNGAVVYTGHDGVLSRDPYKSGLKRNVRDIEGPVQNINENISNHNHAFPITVGFILLIGGYKLVKGSSAKEATDSLSNGKFLPAYAKQGFGSLYNSVAANIQHDAIPQTKAIANDCGGDCYGACLATCSGGCSGTCLGNCSGGCNGCQGCRGTCSGECSGGCSGTCKGSCSGGCTGCTNVVN